MADLSKIEWCDATLNLWWGCTKVSDGCKFCYAENLSDTRHKKGAWGAQGKRLEIQRWRAELVKISKRAKTENRRLRVFCQSMSDTFEGPETCGGGTSENWKLIKRLQLELLAAIVRHPELDFLLLTKRPENVMRAILRMRMHESEKTFEGFQDAVYDPILYPWSCGTPPKNVWIGTSVEDQKTADERIPRLLDIPAAVRFLSCEPLIGRVDLTYPCFNGADSFGSLAGLDWVICGGESGSHSRPMHPEWARQLLHQCVDANVPFLFKQWGEYLPCGQRGKEYHKTLEAGEPNPPIQSPEIPDFFFSDDQGCLKVGKKKAGRYLDGRLYDGFPKSVEVDTKEAK